MRAPNSISLRERGLDLLERAHIVVYQFSLAPLRVDYVSQNVTSLLGVSPEHFYANPGTAFETVHPDDLPLLDRSLVDFSERRAPMVLRWRHADGRMRWFEHHRFPIPGSRGEPSGQFIGLAFEITGRAGTGETPVLDAQTLALLAERVERMREEERTRIARELHDQLGQLLTGIKLDFSTSIRRLRELRTSGDIVDRLQSAMGQIEVGIAIVKRFSTDLRTDSLDLLGLGGAMEYEARRISAQSGVAVTFVNRLAETVPSRAATTAFRVFQEAVTNAVRHAHATSIQAVAATTRHHRLVILVGDDGVGIPRAALRDSRSVGLRGMRERADTVGGRLLFSGRRGRGTRVVLRIPLPRS